MTTKVPNAMLENGGLGGGVIQVMSATTSAIATLTTASAAGPLLRQSGLYGCAAAV